MRAESPKRSTPAPPPSAPEPAREPAPAEPRTFIPDDVTFGVEELPAGFWEAPAEAAPQEVAGQTEPEPAGDAAPPSDLEQAFTELQRLFPGRVLEVRAVAPDEAASGGAPQPLDDEEGAEGGYDDDDQDRLSFGPGDA